MKDRMKTVFSDEIESLNFVSKKIDNSISEIIEEIYSTTGKCCIIGVGKSGLIGKKIAATFSSTGTKSIFLNAAECLHGDLGAICKDDICILISNSGTTEEVVNLIPSLKIIGVKIIALTGNIHSKLATSADHIIDVGVEKEACPLNIAPTSSTTATLVMGDAIAVCLMERNMFTPDNFALYHPGGALGRKLLSRVQDKMKPIDNISIVAESKSIYYLLSEIEMENGIVLVNDEHKNVSGLLTDGDLRRIFKKYGASSFELVIGEVMTKNFKKIDNQNELLINIIDIFAINSISMLPVFEKQKCVGILEYKEVISII